MGLGRLLYGLNRRFCSSLSIVFAVVWKSEICSSRDVCCLPTRINIYIFCESLIIRVTAVRLTQRCVTGGDSGITVPCIAVAAHYRCLLQQ